MYVMRKESNEVRQAIQTSVSMTLLTSEGTQYAKPGDYIVAAKTGCTWRVPKDVFESHYVMTDPMGQKSVYFNEN